MVLKRILPLGALALVADWLAKEWVKENLPLGDSISVAGEFARLTHAENSGVAFGLLASTEIFPAAISLVVVLALALFLILLARESSRAPWGMGLILGGALGNLLDRVPDGRVTDFLDFGVGRFRWPAFNLADTFITLGVTLLVFALWREESRSDPSPIGAFEVGAQG